MSIHQHFFAIWQIQNINFQELTNEIVNLVSLWELQTLCSPYIQPEVFSGWIWFQLSQHAGYWAAVYLIELMYSKWIQEAIAIECLSTNYLSLPFGQTDKRKAQMQVLKKFAEDQRNS